jgi:hypothetical protein
MESRRTFAAAGDQEAEGSKRRTFAMTKKHTGAFLIVAMLALPAMAQRGPGGGPGDGPATPEAIAQRCVRNINRLAARTVHRIARQTNRTVRAINHLLENDRPEQAAELAARSSERLTNLAERATNRIAAMAERCTDILTEMEAPAELIEHVQGVAADRTAGIAERLAGALARIAEALDPAE